MNTEIMSKLSGVGKVLMARARQAKPEYKLILGGLGVLGGTILACTKTKEAVDAWQKTKKEAEEAKNKVEDGKLEYAKAQTKVIALFLYRMIRIYGISALLWLGGMSSIVSSHVDLRKENGRLLLDTVALKKLFDDYRQHVRDEIGEEEEKKLYFQAQEEEVEVLEENPETGTKRVVKKNATVFKGPNGSKFARNWSPRTSWACDSRSYTDYFLETRIKNLNKKLKTVPFITMNEVYDELEMKPEFGRCLDGLDWGWVWNPNNPDGPNEIIVERLEGWEEVYDEKENRSYYMPCMRLDFNPQPLRGLI